MYDSLNRLHIGHRGIKGGISYGNADFPCELSSRTGHDTSGDSTAAGGIVGKLVLYVKEALHILYVSCV